MAAFTTVLKANDMTLAQVRECVRIVNLAVENAKDLLDAHVHNDGWHKRYVAANIKLKSRKAFYPTDVEDYGAVLDKIMARSGDAGTSIAAGLRERMLEDVDQDEIYALHDQFTTDEGEYYLQEVPNGCRNSKASWWDEHIAKLKETGEDTNRYRIVEQQDTLDKKVAAMEEMKALDVKELRYYSVLNMDGQRAPYPTVFGRSGGWAGVADADEMQEEVDWLEDQQKYYQNVFGFRYGDQFDETTMDQFVYDYDEILLRGEQLLEKAEAALYVINMFEEAVAGMDFESYLDDRIVNDLYDKRAEVLTDVAAAEYRAECERLGTEREQAVQKLLVLARQLGSPYNRQVDFIEHLDARIQALNPADFLVAATARVDAERASAAALYEATKETAAAVDA